MLNAITLKNKIKPGQKISIGDVRTNWRASLIITPHSAVGAATPSPRNDSPETCSIMWPISRVASTISWEMVAGNRCRRKIRTFPAPLRRAASRNSRWRSERMIPRTIRAYHAQCDNAIAIITFVSPVPRMPIKNRASTSVGNVRNTSVNRMMI